MVDVPAVVRRKAQLADAGRWLDELDDLVGWLASAWRLDVGATYEGGTEALVVAVRLEDGTPAVLKLVVPRDLDAARREIAVLRHADGDGCARLLAADEARGALLLERLGPTMHEVGLPYLRRLDALADVATAVWRPAAGLGLPTGAEKATWLIDHIAEAWEQLDGPCDERVVSRAIACAERRRDAHDDGRAVLVHGDVHEWNALRRGDGWALVDPDGLVAEPAYDLGVLLREDPDDLLATGPWTVAQRLADRCGVDVDAAWQWGVVERVSTGLLCERIGLQPVGRQMLRAAELLAPGAPGSPDVALRAAVATDRPFLDQMLAAAADWRPGAGARPIAAVLAEPALCRYVVGWPADGDLGVVAEDAGGAPLGAAWCRRFPADDPGYGFVAPDVPEVSIGVIASARGLGIGRRLLGALADAARSPAVRRLSLSVEVDNPARRLYAELGYRPVAEADGAVTMVLELDGRP